jgi:RsiW-degrading membrane proteinase PrsW (M82 family)
MSFIIALVVALLPAILLWTYIFKKDTKAEPAGQIWKAILWGVVIVIPVVFMETFISDILFGDGGEASSFFGHCADAFFVASIPEESFKLLALWLVLRKNPYFDEHFDGIVYSVCVGLGFATIENIFYVVGDGDWASVGIMRAIFSVPGHYAFAVLMGYYYAQYHFVKRSFFNWICIWAVPVIAHGIYDSIVMNIGINDYLVLPIVALLIFFCVKMHKMCKKKIVAQLALDKPENMEA